MKEVVVVLLFPLLIIASSYDELHQSYLNQGYVKRESLFRNQDIVSKDRNTVILRKDLPRPTLAEYVRNIEANHARFNEDSNFAATRRMIERPIGSSPDDYFEMIPSYMGSIIPGAGPISWTSNCFKDVNASVKWINGQDGKDGAKVHVHMNKKTSTFCDEGYIFATISDFHVHYFIFDGESTIEFRGDFSDDLVYDMAHNGFRVFRFPTGITMTIVDIWETLQLFLGALIGKSVPEWTAEDNVKFLKDHMGWQVEQRTVDVVDIDESTVQSGAFLAVIRFDGLDPMLAWAMGAHTGHTTITLRINGELYVLESTSTTSYWPYQDGIQRTPWKQWLKQAKAAGYNVAYLPLSAKYQKLFDEKKAYQWFKTVEGLPYGFHNMIFSWLDTPHDNYPPPLSSEFFMVLGQFVETIVRDFTGNNFTTFDFVGQALNHRLGTKGLSITDAYMVAGQRGISFADLVTMPEQDAWVYQFSNNRSGPAMVCDVFVTEMYKAAGIFGNMDLQGAEFTNWDVYTLNIYDSSNRPAKCVAADPNLPYCQLLGKYRLTLPDYNTRAPRAHMAEHCPRGQPPLFHKPSFC